MHAYIIIPPSAPPQGPFSRRRDPTLDMIQPGQRNTLAGFRFPPIQAHSTMPYFHLLGEEDESGTGLTV
jgi:hypothetical protein